MEEIFRLDPTTPCSNDIVRAESFSCNFGTSESNEFRDSVDDLFQFEAGNHCTQVTGSDMCDIMKTQIANHPRYPDLLSAYIECQKVGAPPEMARVLEEISREKYPNTFSAQIGADPELDEFMESYTQILRRYKEELSKPFNEATTFLSEIGSQLNSLCQGALSISYDNGSDEAAGTSDDEFSGGEVDEASESQEPSGGGRPLFDEDRDLKGMLMRKYSGYLSSLRKEFLKKRKKGKLPRDARLALLNWWNHHHQWPYPAEEEKARLSEMTGLDQKQINNWFINQRKRHWKPSEDKSLALVEGVGRGGVTTGIGQPSSSTYFVTTGGDADNVIVETP